jgi:pimeloyl-ACP methyl ester carboxylesterase
LQIQHVTRGCLSLLGVLLHPLGRFCGSWLNDLRTPERLDQGLVLVLPGIEGQSLLNHNMARGLADGGVRSAIEVFDWTTGVIVMFLYHLRSARRHKAQAEKIAQRIVEYQRDYPGRPVSLVGHSGGGAMAVLALERLPVDVKITSAILLLAGISPGYNLARALAHVENGIFNFHSRFDIFFLGLGTVIFGTIDGPHTVAAGMVGFRVPDKLDATERELYDQRLHQVPFCAAMIADFNFGGHMGVSNRVFVARHVAPLASRQCKSADSSGQFGDSPRESPEAHC